MKVLQWFNTVEDELIYQLVVVDVQEDHYYQVKSNEFVYIPYASVSVVYSIELLTRFGDPDVQSYLNTYWIPSARDSLRMQHYQYSGMHGNDISVITKL